ncbi:hypothetical protein EDB80DRAFT_688281 [Ilyonectria destructans]|nr:hypothetical protein EDB80DRAFT_688281 [Ilyonectria destructans]
MASLSDGMLLQRAGYGSHRYAGIHNAFIPIVPFLAGISDSPQFLISTHSDLHPRRLQNDDLFHLTRLAYPSHKPSTARRLFASSFDMPRAGYDCTGIPFGAPGSDTGLRARYKRPGGGTPRAGTPQDQQMTWSRIGPKDGEATPKASKLSGGQFPLPSGYPFVQDAQLDSSAINWATADQNRIPPTQFTNTGNAHTFHGYTPGSTQGYYGHLSSGHFGATVRAANLQSYPLLPHQEIEQSPSSVHPTTHDNHSIPWNGAGVATGVPANKGVHTTPSIATYG